jgi:hypothetical protein
MDTHNKSVWYYVSIMPFWLRALVGGIILIVVGLLIWLLPKYQANEARKRMSPYIENVHWKERDKEFAQMEKDIAGIENGARTTIVQAVGGLLFIIGLYFTFKNISITEDGKITDRFSKAVEMLGNAQPDVRVGAIYALERIARDSRKDHWTVMEILTAYLKDRFPINERTEREPSKSEPFSERADKDLQAAISAIARRRWLNTEPDRIDLAGLNLSLIMASHGKFKDVSFNGSNLNKAALVFADLRYAALLHVDLRNANLLEARLNGAYMAEADLRGAHFQGADFENTILSNANLCGVNLSDVKNLRVQQILGAKIDDDTRLPPDIKTELEAEKVKGV